MKIFDTKYIGMFVLLGKISLWILQMPGVVAREGTGPRHLDAVARRLSHATQRPADDSGNKSHDKIFRVYIFT